MANRLLHAWAGIFFTLGLCQIARAERAFNYINPVDVTPGVAAAWTNIDVSAQVPAGATGVIVHIVNHESSDTTYGLRKPGSSDDRTDKMYTVHHLWAMIGVDSGRNFEAYLSSLSNREIWLVGYTMSGVTFFTNAVDKSLSTTSSWIDIDISGDTGADTAIGAIIEIVGTFEHDFGVRNNGSTDNRFDHGRHTWAIIGVDNSELFEGYINNTGVDFFLVGYVTEGATFFTNAVDKSLDTAGSWLEIDISSDTGAETATGAFVEIYSPIDPSNSAHGLRKNGSSEDIVKRIRSHSWGIVEVDSNEVFEGYVDDVGTNFFLTGYSLPVDSDGDGLWDHQEDANTDLDSDPSTTPGPDTDGDTLPNYLDADDDGDGTATSSENADPNTDGDPRDAVDSDRDGQPDYLDDPTDASDGTVATEQKISDTAGGLTAILNNDDRFGTSVASLGDLDSDGINDIVVGAQWDDDGGTNRGAAHILFLNADGTVKAEQKISDTSGGLTATLDNSDLFGVSVDRIGDLDGDGINDIAVGALNDDDGGTNRGAVHILFLNADGTVKAEQKISDTSGGLTATLDDRDGFGISVKGIGDLDGDGINDIAVGAFFDDDGGSDRGAVYVLFLNANGTVKSEQKISDTTGGFTATLDDNEWFGVSVTGIGDLDGDGINDIAVGAEADDDGGTDRGAVHILFLNADGTVKAEQKISDTSGGLTATLDNTDYFGNDVAGIGDLDNDGIKDIAVSAMFDDDGGTDRGAVHILFLNTDGTVKAEQKISDTAGGLAATLDNTDRFGLSVAGIGDLDGDGAIDIAVGAQLDDDGGSDRGAVYVLGLTPTANAAPTAPSSLGPEHRVDGSARLDKQPQLQFTQSDDDAGDTLSYRIQIDDDSDFTSPVVDYISASLAQGATSFTVGQAAGSGSYTDGSQGQQLSRGAYYWRVLSNDGTATSSWSTANAGEVAFYVGLPSASACP